MNCSECGVCEMFACPMGLSPRKVNVYLKKKLRERQLDIPKNTTPRARECDFSGRASTERLIARLSLMAYGDMHANDECSELTPERVVLSTSQHIGKPAVPIKKAGDKVYQGECVAAANGALSGNIHASIDGMLEQVDDEKITIVRA